MRIVVYFVEPNVVVWNKKITSLPPCRIAFTFVRKTDALVERTVGPIWLASTAASVNIQLMRVGISTLQVIVGQWFASISDNGPKAISREVCGATSGIFFKKPSKPAFMHIKQ